MGRFVSLVSGMGLGLLAGTAAMAQSPEAPKADCSKYHKMSDGRWTSTILAKAGTPKDFIVLKPGIAIDRNATVAGLNVSETLDRLCGGK